MHQPKRTDPGLRWKRTSWRATAYAIVLTLAVVATVSLSSSPVDASELQLAPDFTLHNLDGVEISLSDYLGKVIILDFWASWCMPCTKTLPDIHALQEAYADRGVVLLVLCFDRREEDARDYLSTNEYATDNVLWGPLQDVHAVRELFGASSITHTLVIGPYGYIRYSGHPAKVTAEVLQPWLLDEAASDETEEDASEEVPRGKPLPPN